MGLPSYIPDPWNVDAWSERSYGFSRECALLWIFLAILGPANAWGDIYKWTDDRGNTVISNVQPVNPNRVSEVELLVKATNPDAQSPAAPSQAGASRTEQELKARVENLERQLQAQQYAPQPQEIPQSAYSGDYYQAPIPPPPETGYYGGYDSGYYPGNYYPLPPSYFFAVVPARTFVRRPVFIQRPVFVSRPPVFVGRPPVFVGRPPVFVGRPPVFVSQPASGISHRASFAGGAMHGGRR